MYLRKKLFILIVSISLFAHKQALAASNAYIISGEGTVIKINLPENNIITTTTLMYADHIISSGEVAIDIPNSLLAVSSGRFSQDVYLYNLATLTFIKKLNIFSNDYDRILPQVIFLPNASFFYVLWKDPATGDVMVSSYNKSSFTKNADISVSPPLKGKVILSSDGSRLYSILSKYNSGNGQPLINQYSSDTFSFITSTIMSFSPNAFAKVIDDIKSGKVLLVENLKSSRSSPDNLMFFTQNITTGVLSPQIVTNSAGNDYITPDAAQLIFIPTRDITDSLGLVVDVQTTGLIKFYNINSGSHITTLTFSNENNLAVIGISPDSRFLYIEASDAITDQSMLFVIDLNSHLIVKKLSNIDGAFMVFF
jgi:hypothetical protein